ncbi:MAG TPA: hypothetical protein ENG33_06505, partial [Chloroflexi bacterium]|nr:hypothetical protein [Chloroflexota bacterium]
MRLPRAWVKIVFFSLEAGVLILLFWLLTPVFPGFSFVLSVKEDSVDDFIAGSFERTALTSEPGREGVRLLPLGLAGEWVVDSHRLPLKLNNLSAVAYMGKIFVAGGDDEFGTRRREVYSTTINADGSLQPWVTLPVSLPVGLSSGAMVIYPHSELTASLYYIGGIRDDNTFSDKVYHSVVTLS